MKVLQIETTNICNAKCVFCIHSSQKTFGTMSDDLFLKILKDAKEIPTLKTIIPMLLGEPFCDEKIISRLILINRILPEVTIHLYTNGSLLTPSKIHQLLQIKNLIMFFSLNGIDRKTRKKLTGLDDFAHVIEMINLYAQTGMDYKVLLIKHPSISKESIEEFKKRKNTYALSYKNYSGDKFKNIPQTRCIRAISHMTIMYNGLVNLCCMEHGKVIFGDLNKSSIKEVWESKHRQMYVKAHSSGKYLKGPCANCTQA